jgi:hypothetical protein
MFLPSVYAHPHQHLTNSTKFRIQNILLDKQHWYFTVAWPIEFKEYSDFLREISPCGFLITHSLSPFSILMWFPFFAEKHLHVVSILHTFSPWSIFMWFPLYTLFHRQVSPCGFHFKHILSVKYLHVVSILNTFSPWSISMRFPLYTLFHRQVSPCGFHFKHILSVKYLHAVSILNTFSPWSISMWFPFYTPFLREVSSCGYHFKRVFPVKYLHAVSILHNFSCQKMVPQSLNWTDSVAMCATRTEIHGRLFKLW